MPSGLSLYLEGGYPDLLLAVLDLVVALAEAAAAPANDAANGTAAPYASVDFEDLFRSKRRRLF